MMAEDAAVVRTPAVGGDGQVVSFVERQLAIARKRHAEMEASLSEVMAAIEDNARLQMTLHDLALDVMRAHDCATAVRLLREGLLARFSLKDVQLLGMPGTGLPQPLPTETMQGFVQHMDQEVQVCGAGERFPPELWQVPGVVSACVFSLRGRGDTYGLLALGRADDGFAGEVDTLFLRQFVALMGLWLEVVGAGCVAG